MVLMDAYSEWDLVDQPNEYNELNECHVIGCNEYGFPYGFNDLWKVRLCNKHRHIVITKKLRNLDSLHQIKKKQNQSENFTNKKIIKIEVKT